MKITTHKRIKMLRSKPYSASLLKDLHDCIYQWTESIPYGGAKADISNALQSIYDKHLTSATTERPRLQAEAESGEWSKYLSKEDDDTEEQDDMQDEEEDESDDSDEEDEEDEEEDY